MASYRNETSLSQKPFIQFILLELVCIGFMLADRQTQMMQPVRSALSALTLPLIKTIEWPQKLWEISELALSRQAALVQENTALKQALIDARMQVQQNTLLSEENTRLRRLLKAGEQLPLDTSVAFVSNINLSENKQQVMINQGTQHGVYNGQAVLSLDGVIGQVEHHGLLYSHVILISDRNHAIPVENVRTGLRSIAYGRGDPTGIDLPELPASADVKIGDVLITSGFGHRFPRGLRVASIVDLQPSADQSFLHARAQIFAGMSQLTEVFLVWPEGEAADVP